jgi:hypothetical protein
MKILSVGMVSCLLSRFIKLNYCQKIVNPNIMESNKQRKELIEFLKESNVMERFKSSVKASRDPMQYSLIDNLKMGYLPSLFPFSILYQQNDVDSRVLSFIIASIGALVFGGVHALSDAFIGDMLVGSAACTSLMAGYIIISSLTQMRQVKSAVIPWGKVSALLQRPDIMIE